VVPGYLPMGRTENEEERAKIQLSLAGSFQLNFGAFAMSHVSISVRKRPMPRHHGAMARHVNI